MLAENELMKSTSVLTMSSARRLVSSVPFVGQEIRPELLRVVARG